MTIEKWDYFELELDGLVEGNPFTDVYIRVHFLKENRRVPVEGFYDGNGTYLVRFMPDSEGKWEYRSSSNVQSLDGLEGAFTCAPAKSGNHGPVSSRGQHLQYADGSPYFCFGTTCYAWVHQSNELQAKTLETLKTSPFNKIRMCIFPKWYPFNRVEPQLYPFEGSAPDRWDFTRFNPAFFRNIEDRILALRSLGIEADLILFHPYDEGHWRFDRMSREDDERYLRYTAARFSAFRNVWWSFANEYDLMKEKQTSDWDRFFKIVQETDPAGHMRGIHNCRDFYDHGKPWVTHCSIQHSEAEKLPLWRRQYGKPVILDECRYEGDIHFNWGNISGRSLVDKFWKATVLGGYAGHGETYLHPEDILWWSKGGELYGASPPRIAFLKEILEQDAAEGRFSAISPLNKHWNDSYFGGEEGRYYLMYLSAEQQPKQRFLNLPEDREFSIEVIDCWDMTITPLSGRHSGSVEITLPGKPMTALRARLLE
jgi:hypothetical protein